MVSKVKNPYLENNRLTDVIAAIQAMGTYKFYKLPFDNWADRISGDAANADHWMVIFKEHPEFFRLDGNREKASLVWRRQYPRRYHVDLERKLTQAEYDNLPPQERQDRLSRIPLTSDDIKALVTTAVDLHARALEEKKESRWWVPWIPILGALLSVVGGLIGALIGVSAKH
jgi:hypothetical protein